MKKGQKGFTLLEVLVAIVVMSLGLLGLAGLQAMSLRNNQTAHYRSIATQQAYDMADRMRANLAGVRNGNYDNLTATIPTNPNCINTGGGCSSSNVAATDHSQWNSVNAALLPNGVGTVACAKDGSGNCIRWAFDIIVSWTERGETGSGTRSFDIRVWP